MVMVSEARVGAKKAEKIEGDEEFGEVYQDLVKVVLRESSFIKV